MAVEATQKNNIYSPRKTSILGAATVGAALGYTAKWLIPITTQEKDEIYNKDLLDIKNATIKARNDEKAAIMASKQKGADTFTKLAKEGKLNRDSINKLKGKKREFVSELYSRLSKVMLEIKKVSKKELMLKTKNLRPTGMFILAGAGITSMLASIHNTTIRLNEFD